VVVRVRPRVTHASGA